MNEFLTSLLSLVVPAFAVTSMLSVGLGYTVRQLVDPLRNGLGVILALVANFLLVPLLAYTVARLLSLDRPFEVGLILVAFAGGAPFVIKLTQIAGGNVAFSAGLLVLLVVATIGYMPLVVPLALPDATVSASAIARPLLMTMLLPLGIGLALRALLPSGAARLQPIMGRIANLVLAALFVLTLLVNLRAILGVFGHGAILAGLLVLVGAFVIGYLLGNFSHDTRDEVALCTAQRNYAAAMVVAQSFDDPDVLVMVVVVSVVSMALLFPAARLLHRLLAAGAGPAAGSEKEPRMSDLTGRTQARS
jgi:BASS family bile acid:Na+ symporter